MTRRPWPAAERVVGAAAVLVLAGGVVRAASGAAAPGPAPAGAAVGALPQVPHPSVPPAPAPTPTPPAGACRSAPAAADALVPPSESLERSPTAPDVRAYVLPGVRDAAGVTFISRTRTDLVVVQCLDGVLGAAELSALLARTAGVVGVPAAGLVPRGDGLVTGELPDGRHLAVAQTPSVAVVVVSDGVPLSARWGAETEIGLLT